MDVERVQIGTDATVTVFILKRIGAYHLCYQWQLRNGDHRLTSIPYNDPEIAREHAERFVDLLNLEPEFRDV